jgi:hypothetical protein
MNVMYVHIILNISIIYILDLLLIFYIKYKIFQLIVNSMDLHKL